MVAMETKIAKKLAVKVELHRLDSDSPGSCLQNETKFSLYTFRAMKTLQIRPWLLDYRVRETKT